MPMNDRSKDEFTFEKGLRELGQRIRDEYGIVPLKPGEIRPIGYYGRDHYWGLPAKRVRKPSKEADR
jgi:hypothetical protein